MQMLIPVRKSLRGRRLPEKLRKHAAASPGNPGFGSGGLVLVVVLVELVSASQELGVRVMQLGLKPSS